MDENMDRLASIFNNTLFRIPDYQRGYAWERSQLDDFWKDLTWLRPGQLHYTGMLTFRAVTEHREDMLEGSPHRIFHVVDGQQRLTTIFLLLRKLIQRSVQLLAGQPLPIVSYTYLTASLAGRNIDVFGYDAPAKMEFLRRIGNHPPPSGETLELVPRNTYELNLLNASVFLDSCLHGMAQHQLDDVFIRLTQQLVFDVHHVTSTFDVCAMFESINYRGKKLTKFEVLKNRLIYLTELLGQADPGQQTAGAVLREKIDAVWGEAFDWLGHSNPPLSEDEFLLHHTTMYIGPLPKVQDALDRVLFKLRFSNDRLSVGEDNPITLAEIDHYVESVRQSSQLWAFQNASIDEVEYFPHSNDITDWLRRLNRLTMRHFRPLILGALNELARPGTQEGAGTFIELLISIERFIFIVYGLCDNHSNHSSKTYFANYGKAIYYNESECSFTEIVSYIDDYLDSYDEDGVFIGEFSPGRFIEKVHARFIGEQGWRSWGTIKYFLSEWASSFLGENARTMSESAYKYTSIEHIMPQNPAGAGQWQSNQKALGKRFKYVLDDIGNLTLLGVGANKAVMDIDLECKAAAYRVTEDGQDILKRAGRKYEWGEKQILDRGKDMISFICERWNLPGQDDEDSELLFDHDDVLSTNVKAPRQKRKK